MTSSFLPAFFNEMAAAWQDRTVAGVWWRPSSKHWTRQGPLGVGSSGSYFYQIAFDTALVLGDREVLYKVTGLSHALKVVVLLF